MECRIGCGACCIALSISSPIPGMPNGKPAGVRCIQLSEDNRCRIYHDPRRPQACEQFKPSPDLCGSSQAEALRAISDLEADTSSLAVSADIQIGVRSDS